MVSSCSRYKDSVSLAGGGGYFGELGWLAFELQRQLDAEAGAARVGVFHANRAAVLGNDAVADAKAQAGAFADRFSGVERIKDARGIFHAGAAVGKFHKNRLLVEPGSDP